jgi:DNA helicase II / ATP-dependent DNA helicase PcrA
MASDAFLEAVKELRKNKEQFTAFESKGHFVALAGPGSGKTKLLTTKLAQMLEDEVEVPQGICCVTYSSECARELKRQLESLGVSGNSRVFIGTVHSFCLQHVVMPFAKLAGLAISDPIKIATIRQRQYLFETAVENRLGKDQNPANWRTTCDSYRRSVLDRDAPEWRTTDKVASAVVEEYESLLRRDGLIDFDDMMLLGLSLIRQHEWVRKAVIAKFPILVVDEYQDLGVPLHEIVMSLCFREGVHCSRLFAVGDPDQSIYGFTGARPELLKNLASRSDVQSVTLSMNYRSRQSIVSASEVALGDQRGYRSSNQEFGLIDFHKCPGGLSEQAEKIVQELIPAVLKNGIARNLGEIAVLYTTKAEGDVFDAPLDKAKIQSIRIDGNAPYLKTPLTRWLEDCAVWITTDLAKSTKCSFRLLSQEYFRFNEKAISEREKIKCIHQLAELLVNSRDMENNLRIWLVRMSDFVRPALESDSKFEDDIQSLEKLIAATDEGQRLSKWTIAQFGGQGGSPEHLNLMTLHSYKGLEFDVVFMFGMDQGILPSYRARSDESKREQRRLFYVGLTRARHEVHITYSGWRTGYGGKRAKDGESEFVVELQKKLTQNQ